MNESWSSDAKWQVSSTENLKAEEVLVIEADGDIHLYIETVKEVAIELIKQQPFF